MSTNSVLKLLVLLTGGLVGLDPRLVSSTPAWRNKHRPYFFLNKSR